MVEDCRNLFSEQLSGTVRGVTWGRGVLRSTSWGRRWQRTADKAADKAAASALRVLSVPRSGTFLLSRYVAAVIRVFNKIALVLFGFPVWFLFLQCPFFHQMHQTSGFQILGDLESQMWNMDSLRKWILLMVKFNPWSAGEVQTSSLQHFHLLHYFLFHFPLLTPLILFGWIPDLSFSLAHTDANRRLCFPCDSLLFQFITEMQGLTGWPKRLLSFVCVRCCVFSLGTTASGTYQLHFTSSETASSSFHPETGSLWNIVLIYVSKCTDWSYQLLPFFSTFALSFPVIIAL